MTSPLRSFASAGDPLDTSAREAAEHFGRDWISVGGYFDPPEAPVGHHVEVKRDAHLGIVTDYRFVPTPFTGQLWLDMDGVLADFDSAACAALQTDNTYKWEWIHGTKAFWAGLNANPNFFLDLPPMQDAWFLLESVRHLNPKVLTALPKTDADTVAEQKREWIARHVGDLEVVTCPTHEKPDYCQPGDVLVDDRAVNRAAWEKKGGRYVLHTDALSSVRELREMGVL